MSTRYSTPLVSDTERGLIERSKRMNAPVPPLLVKLYQAPEIALQLPDQESALTTISRRIAAPVADLQTAPDVTLTATDLEESGLDLFRMEAQV